MKKFIAGEEGMPNREASKHGKVFMYASNTADSKRWKHA